MRRQYLTHFSRFLNRDMHLLAYGHAGIPVIAFPCQDGMCDNWEGFQMPQELSGYLDAGVIQLFCVDTVDKESFSDKGGDKAHRAWVQEQYFRYITEEALPFIRSVSGTEALPLVTGFSLGAVHAAIVFFRRPDLFRGVLGCSGCYCTPRFWDYWCDSTLYDNSPVDFLQNMPADHPYIDLYNQKKIVLCVGQGRWEGGCLIYTKQMRDIFAAKGIHGWVDLWGFDVDHDWPWWKKQMHYHLPGLLED